MRGVALGAACITLLLATSLRAAELKLVTWDFGWLTARPAGDPALPDNVKPKRSEDVFRLARYAAALRADVVALQGVDGPDVAARVFPPADYVMVLAEQGLLQRTGFAVRRGVRIERHPDLATLNTYRGAFQLRVGTDVTVGGVRLLSVHLKSGCRDGPLDAPDRPACRTLARQGAALAEWIAAREGAGEAFVLLGDFGRVMEGADPFLRDLAPAGTLVRPTAGQASPCWGGQDFVDHILVGGPARAWVVAGSLRVMAYRGTEGRDRLGDHCPVSIRLDVPE